MFLGTQTSKAHTITPTTLQNDKQKHTSFQVRNVSAGDDSDDDEQKDSTWFLNKIKHLSGDSDFFDNSDEDNHLEATHAKQKQGKANIIWWERHGLKTKSKTLFIISRYPP